MEVRVRIASGDDRKPRILIGNKIAKVCEEPRPLADLEIKDDFFKAVLDMARERELMWDEPFAVDGGRI